MTPQHTPGPWTVSPLGSVVDKRACRVATPEQMPGINAEEQAANARLIAAAPEMIAALEAIARGSIVDTGSNQLGCVRLDMQAMQAIARSVIAKAKGPTEYDVAKQEAATWRAKAARDDHPGRGFCLTQAARWEARAAIAKAKGGAE